MEEVNLECLDFRALPVPPSLGASGSHQQAQHSPKKIRKPYTISKSRESWNDQEHEKFLEALQLFDRDWKKIESFVGTKSVIQIRSHAQKYFLKVQKNGTGEHVPPPRPKRKATQAYPQKASTTGLFQQQTQLNFGSSASSAGVEFPLESPRLNVYQPAVSSTAMPNQSPPELCAWNASFGLSTSEPGPVAMSKGTNYSKHSSSSVVSSGGWSHDSMLCAPGSDQSLPLKATPNFAEVYKFIGRVFDPDVGCHSNALSELAPIDRETVLLLMKNLVINISSPEFQEQKTLLSNSYPSSTTNNQNSSIGADGLNSISCSLPQPAANGSSSFSGEQEFQLLNDDENLFQFKTGSNSVVYHAHFSEAQLQSPTHLQISDDRDCISDIMSLPPLIVGSPLPTLANSTPWSSNKISWESIPARSFYSVQAIS